MYMCFLFLTVIFTPTHIVLISFNSTFLMQVDERLKDYENAFDIVIVDDHSIETVDLLLMKLFHCQ